MEEVLKFLKDNHVFYFATVDGDKPRVRPFGFSMIYDGKICFGIGTHKQSYAQILKNPNVEICTCDPKGTWLRLRGKAVPVEDAAATEAAYEVMPQLKNMYSPESGLKLGIVALTEAEAEIADMAGRFDKCTF